MNFLLSLLECTRGFSWQSFQNMKLTFTVIWAFYLPNIHLSNHVDMVSCFQGITRLIDHKKHLDNFFVCNLWVCCYLFFHYFSLKSFTISFLALFADFFTSSGIWLINQAYHLYKVFFTNGLLFLPVKFVCLFNWDGYRII